MTSNVEDLIKRHEGLRLKPYVDTVGKVTIGYGHNLTDLGVPQSFADALFQHDLEVHWQELHEQLPWVGSLDAVRHAVLVDLAFNMGIPRLKRFKRTLRSIKEGRWDDASRELLDSKYARQVKGRARRLAKMLRTGEWPTD
jgi:lysozyme